MKPEVEQYRIKTGIYRSSENHTCGLFEIPYESFMLKVLVYDGSGDGWEHVSVSLKNRCPNWKEMCYIKDLFWHEDEYVVQYHPAKKDYVNMHPYCLHLWRNKDQEIIRPPSYLVGI